TVVGGVRMTLETSRERSLVPVRTAMVGAVGAVAAVVAAASLVASLHHLGQSPRRYGVAWDALVGNFADDAAAGVSSDRMVKIPEVEAFAGVGQDPGSVDGHAVAV